MTTLALNTASQGLEPGDQVILFQIDTSVIGGTDVWYLCPTGACTFQGIAYTHFDIQAEGFEYNGQGQMPQPKLRLTHVTLFAGAALRDFNDLIGARVTRIKTYRQFLDDGAEADTNAHYAPDIYVIEQKTSHNKYQVEWTLSAAMDQQGRMLPGRRILQSVCVWRYRSWDALNEEFVYSHVTCPYEGTTYFESTGDLTADPSLDVCGKRLSDCKKRFGDNAVLPYGGFPGVGRIQQ